DAPLRDVEVMRAPVGQLAAGEIGEPAELVVHLIRPILSPRRGAEPKVPIEVRWRFAHRRPVFVVDPADICVDSLELSNLAVAHQFARRAKSLVGALLAACLKDRSIATR